MTLALRRCTVPAPHHGGPWSRRRADGGYSLIEALAITIILAILAMIALVTYIGLRAKFQDRTATQALRDVEQLAKQALVEDGAILGEEALIAALQAQGGRGPYVLGAVPVRIPRTISVLERLGPTTTHTFTAYSASGRCFFLRMDERARVERHQEDSNSDGDGSFCEGAMFGPFEVPLTW